MRSLKPAIFVWALWSCAAAAEDGPGVRLGTHHRWTILTDASSLDRIDFGQIVITNSKQVQREWRTTQSLWVRMQSRVIVLPQHAYAALARRSRQASCSEDPS